MPYLNSRTIVTNVKGVRQAQAVLKLMHTEPWMVEKVGVSKEGIVQCTFMDYERPMDIGVISQKYSEALKKDLHVQSWQITGGEPMTELRNQRGTPLRYFGVNLRILILSQAGEAATANALPPKALSAVT